MRTGVILVSAVAGDIGASVVRSLVGTGYTIIGCDIKPYSPVSDIVDKYYVVPSASERESYIDAIKDIIKEQNVNFFLPISEPEIELVNAKRYEFEELDTRLLLNNKRILDIFLDKLKTALYLNSIGIRIPKTVLLKEYEGGLDFPLIVKSRRGYGSRSIWKVENPNDLVYLKNKDNGSFIVQQYIGSAEVEFTTGVFSDGRNVSSITFRRILGVDGTTLEVLLSNEEYLNGIAERIAKATDLVGYINIQSRRVGDIFLPFEINPRISGTILFRKKFGFDDVIWWIDVLSGGTYIYKPLYKSGRAMRYYSELFFDMVKISE